jgi:hypothetical protein
LGAAQHAGEQDADAALLQPRHHGVEVLLGDVRRDAAQHVVGAEFEDDESVPSGTDQSSRARPPLVVSPETPALRSRHRDPFAFSAACSFVGKALAGAEAVAGHQAVAEADDANGSVPAGAKRQERDKCHGRKCAGTV